MRSASLWYPCASFWFHGSLAAVGTKTTRSASLWDPCASFWFHGSLAAVAPYDSLDFSAYFFPVKRPWPSETKNLHFHMQNLTVIEPKNGTIFAFLYIFPYVALYDSLYFSPYFFPVKWPWQSEAQNLHFHIQNLTVIEPKKRYYFFIPLYIPLCRPL